MQDSAITFSPTLSVAKEQAIKNLGFGDVIKIGLLFDKAFWVKEGIPAEKQYHYFSLADPPTMDQDKMTDCPKFAQLCHKDRMKIACPATCKVSTGESTLANSEKFHYFLNLVPAVKRNVLFTFGCGGSARNVETWTDEEVWKGVRANLVQLFGEAKVPALANAMWRSNWGANPHFKGAYTYSSVKTTQPDWENIQTSEMSGRLLFAGEHTTQDWRGTNHGAFFSGINAAKKIRQAKSCASYPQADAVLAWSKAPNDGQTTKTFPTDLMQQISQDANGVVPE